MLEMETYLTGVSHSKMVIVVWADLWEEESEEKIGQAAGAQVV